MPIDVRLNTTHDFILTNKRELQQITSNYSSDIEFKDCMKLYKDYTKEAFSVLVNDTFLPSDSSLRFRTVRNEIKTIGNKIEQNKA